MYKISVITTFYNQESSVLRCLQSVLNQQYQNWEIIAVNDCSSDRTAERLAEAARMDERIKVVNNTTNRRCGGSRNVGIEHSTGDCFFILDGDDTLPPDALSTLIEHFTPEVDSVQGGFDVFDTQGKHLTRWYCHGKTREYRGNANINANLPDIEWDRTINHLINSRHKDLRYAEGLAAHEDRLYNIELFKRMEHLVIVPKPTYNFVFEGNRPYHKEKNFIEAAVTVLEAMVAAKGWWRIYSADFLRSMENMMQRCASDYGAAFIEKMHVELHAAAGISPAALKLITDARSSPATPGNTLSAAPVSSAPQVRRYRLLGCIPFLKVRHDQKGGYTVLLFHFLPLLRCRVKPNGRQYLFLSALPLLSVR